MGPLPRVIVEEVNSGERGIGGKGMTTQDVKALAAANQRANREEALTDILSQSHREYFMSALAHNPA
jgi:hypothetical protein